LEHVLSPFKIGSVELRNRIVRTSQGTGLSVDQQVSDALVAYLTVRARGGISLLFADPGQVHWSSPGILDMSTDAAIPGTRRLTDAVHSEGAKVFQQIWHGGPTQIPLDSTAPWAASHVPDPGLNILPVPMTKWMIDELTEAFVSASLRAREGGIDGIEFHAGHGYVFSTFLSPATNHRTDEYGGSLENRSRFLFEVIAAVRAAVGPEYPIGVRLSADGPDDQSTVEQLGQVAVDLEASGLIHYVNMSLGSHYRRDLLMGGFHEKPGYQLAWNEPVTRKLSLPTIVTGRFTSLQQAEEVVASGAADLVAMVRATLAEPDLVRKTLEGRTDEIRPCIACLQSCAGGLNTRGVAMCTVNPSSGRELTHGDQLIVQVTESKHVVVVGGGPAGMEAARSAAIAGHRVTLLEATGQLGGQLRLKPAEQGEIHRLVAFYARQLELQRVDVRLGMRATAQSVHELAPDAVIIATGVAPRRDGFQALRPAVPLPGLDQVRLYTGWDVLQGAELGHTVLLLDDIGHYESVDVAQSLVENGHRVLQVSRYGMVAANIEMRWEMMGAALAARLGKRDFTLYPRSVIHRLEAGKAQVAPNESPHRMEIVEFDDVVLMSGGVPDRALQEELRGVAPVVRVIGDANAPRRLEIAFMEGRQVVDALGADWAPVPRRYGWGGSAT
jgi:2,4-dienoyl-CoA reductase-like NADH-dependent reductase (Old Yellow Enzyme family)